MTPPELALFLQNPIFWAISSPIGLILIKRLILGVKKSDADIAKSDADIAKSNIDISAAEGYKKVIDLMSERLDTMHRDNVELHNTINSMLAERHDLVSRISHLETVILGLRNDLSTNGAIA